MEVPSILRALWVQRRRWARGQGEALNAHLSAIVRWRRRRLWPLALEATASLVWVVALAIAATLTVLAILNAEDIPVVSLGIAWGIAVSVVATLQLALALQIDFPHDRRAALVFFLGPLYPLAYWLISALAAVREELPAFLRGPAAQRVSWDLPRDAPAPKL
jgi:biofilm PGA synthesis N-glycosyltransferase PgaC